MSKPNFSNWILTGVTVCIGILSLSSRTAFAQNEVITQFDEITQAESHISSSNTGGDNKSGININGFLGAERFYDAGYTGSRARIGNIEAGHADSGHETLGHVTTQVTGTGATGAIDGHATSVTHSMAGRLAVDNYPNDYFAYGISRSSPTWSGAIATSIMGNNFNISSASVASVYSTMIETGVAGQTVDVFNSSWGFTDNDANNIFAVGVDGFVNRNGTVSVFSAGNSGATANPQVGGIGAGYNSITVAALGSDTGAPPFNSVSGFSSRGPNDFFNASTNTTTNSVRAAVDIAAPGQNLTLANAGTTSGYSGNGAGTSFAAPIVAGGAALVVDSGKDLYSGNSNAIDGRVIKSVLLNSADKIAGWSNAQSNVGGIVTTTQSLDYASGAGRMNLDRTFDQYINNASGGMAGTTDVAGTAQGDLGNVSNVGWDYGEVDTGDSNLYFIDTQLAANSNMTLTLSWFADTNPGSAANFAGAAYQHLANLNLKVFQFDDLVNRNVIATVAQSISQFNVVEHLSFLVQSQGFYGIEVEFLASHWNFTAEQDENYGLAWFSTAATVPEPTSLMLMSVGVVAIFSRRRRR